MADAKKPQEPVEDFATLTPGDFAGAVNLMAHPVAGVAAATALGFGLASQAFGMWAGAMVGAAEASQRLFMPKSDDVAEKPASVQAVAPVVARKAAVIVDIATAKNSSTRQSRRGERPSSAGDVAQPVATQPVIETVAPAASTGFAAPKAVAQPSAPDDLKLISGIGPKLEKVLNGLGVWTHGQIAEWGAAEIGWVDDRLSFNGRIDRDDWTGQAAMLAKAKTKH